MLNFLIHLLGGVTKREAADREEVAIYHTRGELRDQMHAALVTLGISLDAPVQTAYETIEQTSADVDRLNTQIAELSQKRSEAISKTRNLREAVGFFNS